VIAVCVTFFVYPFPSYQDLTGFEVFKLRKVKSMADFITFPMDSSRQSLIQCVPYLFYDDGVMYLKINDLLVSFKDIDTFVPRPLFNKMVRLCYNLAYLRKNVDYLQKLEPEYNRYNNELQGVLEEIYQIISITNLKSIPLSSVVL
jgi:hypothetical protein